MVVETIRIPPIEVTIERMKREIKEDVLAGRVPPSCRSFGELQDHVDANEYGGFCEDEFADALIAHFGGRDKHEGMPDGMLAYMNLAHNSIGEWIDGGALNEFSNDESLDSPVSLADFLGPARDIPSSMMAVTNEDASEIMEVIAEQEYGEPVWQRDSLSIRLSTATCSPVPTAGLFAGVDMVGFYENATLWISEEYRGRGLSTPLIVETAKSRGGVLHTDPDDFYGFSEAGLAAHERAYAVLAASWVKDVGRPIPDAVKTGEHHGPIKSVIGNEVIQSAGAGRTVTHDARNLDVVPKEGDKAAIKYGKDGMASVRAGNEKSQAKDHGR